MRDVHLKHCPVPQVKYWEAPQVKYCPVPQVKHWAVVWMD